MLGQLCSTFKGPWQSALVALLVCKIGAFPWYPSTGRWQSALVSHLVSQIGGYHWYPGECSAKYSQHLRAHDNPLWYPFSSAKVESFLDTQVKTLSRLGMLDLSTNFNWATLCSSLNLRHPRAMSLTFLWLSLWLYQRNLISAQEPVMFRFGEKSTITRDSISRVITLL